MLLRFIGAKGSMGLTRGKIYDVEVKTIENYIWVRMPKFEFRPGAFKEWNCPYSSPQTLSANWELP